ncbi:hypothetical protein CIB95_04765 [Lottiidibacillus patelloidae]|uniref:DUF92 domain-containing protein n=1 Tax=Lottiidibacillus patelloidae TaxID=2670334 RepID=A0A263BWX2_9BACI|nr:DUF92 domain-containing protein [Lottiidibacillus patelloidae]OZM57686.1 hypothetical protein CIB95_04765 [Lottiidibacillus patelloidae]
MIIDYYLIPILILAAYIGHRYQMLTRLGAVGTILVGFSVLIGFGYKGIFLLGAFFISSSFWSSYKKEKKVKVEEKIEKSAGRDFVQVVANGGLAAVCGFLYYLTKDNSLLAIFIASIAAANSDTWASELGVLSKKKPFLLLSGKETDPGTSGAVSSLGLLASLAGAFLIALLAMLLFSLPMPYLILFTIIGFMGSVIDTILGALLQRKFKCQVCGLETEKKMHCHKETELLHGFIWISNDTVNFLSILFAGLLGGMAVVL